MESNEKNETYAFIRLPKKASYLLNVTERSLFGVMIDYQQLVASYKKTDSPEEIIRKQKISFDISISYLVQNLAITDKTVQKAINKLIQFGLINKQSGAISRKKNSYSINFEKIRELDRLSNDQIFEMRSRLSESKNIELTDSVKPKEAINPIQPDKIGVAEKTEVHSTVATEEQEEIPIQIKPFDLIDDFNDYLGGLGDKAHLIDKMKEKYNAQQIDELFKYVNSGTYIYSNNKDYMNYLRYRGAL